MCASFTTNALMGKRLNVALSNHGEERKRDEGLYATNLGAVAAAGDTLGFRILWSKLLLLISVAVIPPS